MQSTVYVKSQDEMLAVASALIYLYDKAYGKTGYDTFTVAGDYGYKSMRFFPHTRLDIERYVVEINRLEPSPRA